MEDIAFTNTSPVQGMKNIVEDVDDAASSATRVPADVTGGQEVTSAIKGFGSPAPASPLDAAAKVLDFDAKAPTSPSTPVLPPASTGAGLGGGLTPASPSLGFGDDSNVDYDAFIKDTLLWSNKVRSGVYLVGGVLLIYLTHRVLTANTSLVTALCYVVLGQAALNFFRAFLSPKLQERCTWHDSVWTHRLLAANNSVVKGAAALHDKHLSGQDAGKMLRITAAVWGISLLGRSMSLTTLITTLWIAAFVVPKLYMTFKRDVDRVVLDISQQAKGHFMKLDPKARAALVVVPVFAAGYALSSTDLAVAVLALMMYGRSCMAPAQVDKLNSVVAPPITSTVTKVGGTVSKLMANAANKFDLTPTPAKAKRA